MAPLEDITQKNTNQRSTEKMSSTKIKRQEQAITRLGELNDANYFKVGDQTTNNILEDGIDSETSSEIWSTCFLSPQSSPVRLDESNNQCQNSARPKPTNKTTTKNKVKSNNNNQSTISSPTSPNNWSLGKVLRILEPSLQTSISTHLNLSQSKPIVAPNISKRDMNLVSIEMKLSPPYRAAESFIFNPITDTSSNYSTKINSQAVVQSKYHYPCTPPKVEDTVVLSTILDSPPRSPSTPLSLEVSSIESLTSENNSFSPSQFWSEKKSEHTNNSYSPESSTESSESVQSSLETESLEKFPKDQNFPGEHVKCVTCSAEFPTIQLLVPHAIQHCIDGFRAANWLMVNFNLG